MARIPIIAGNWKMNTLRRDAIDLANGVRSRSDGVRGVEKIVCPPFVYLHDVRAALDGSTIRIGAQNAYWEESGPFTGEVSITQIGEAASYVLIGHSERRMFFNETDHLVNDRVRSALAHGVKPIMCVGETLAQREGGETTDVLVRQTREGLANIRISGEFVIAYEPVWAIGTGLAADGTIAQEAIGLIRSTVREIAGDVADRVRILYGGSVTPDNIAEFLAQADIDGGLVGGASLKADVFAAIIDGAATVTAQA